MDTGWFSDAGALSGSIEQQLDGMGGDMVILFGPFKQPLRGAIFPPVLSQLLQGRLGQNGVTILASLALSDPDHHPFTINIGEFKACCLAHSQSRRIRHHQARGVTSSSVMFSVGVASSLLTGKNSIASDLIFKSTSYERLGSGLSIAILVILVPDTDSCDLNG